jgi:BirA family biotin operon repressor/biotin-[acetyl-CoA-carboxylase] ligase
MQAEDPALMQAVAADLHDAAERIWEATQATCPALTLEIAPEIGSTNTELMARGRRGETSPTLLVACCQRAGRGRLGRQWQAAPGKSLTFSLGLPLRLDAVPGGGSALSLAVGLSVAQALDAGLHDLNGGTPCEAIGVKWPNDLWFRGRKLGGILIEASPAPGLTDGQRWVVIGIGLNVRDPDHALPAGAVALQGATSGPGPRSDLSIGQVWRWVAPSLIRAVLAFETEGFAPLQDAYGARDVLAGQTVGLWTQPGLGLLDGTPASDTGIAQGVSETGALLVHTDKGLQSWTTGEVSVRLHPSA